MKALFSVFLDATFYGSVMILVTLLLRPILRNAPRRILCFLWLFVMVRLLLPVSIESKLSLQPHLIPIQTIIEHPPETPSSPPVQIPVAPSPEMPLDVTVPVQPTLEMMDVIPIVWFSVMCATFAYMAISYSLLRRQIRDAIPLKKGIWESDRIPGAFMLGYLWPQIYLPTGLDPADQQLIINHEKAHIHRGDAWWKLLGMFCLCIHWYNPLVWLAYSLISRDIETACDEQVIRAMPLAQRKAYSYALLNGGKRMVGIFISPAAFAEINLKQRIQKVLSYRNPGIWITVTAIILSTFIVFFFITVPVPEPQDILSRDDPQSTQSTENTTKTTDATRETQGEPAHIHTWQAATCTAPKICTTCGATEGSAKTHNYANRKCTGCGVLLPTEELRFTKTLDNKSYLCHQYTGADSYVVIPAVYNGLPVTAVGPLCSKHITYITLPNSITSIADRTFMAEENLQSIILPSGITTLGEATFMDCLRMTSITLPQNLTAIGPYAFARCRSLAAIHIPASVTSIGEGAFQNCTQLKSITFAGTVAQWNAIEKGADWNSTDLNQDWIFESTVPAAGVACFDGFVPF